MAESTSHFVMHDRQGRQISLLNDHAQDHHEQHIRRCEARSMSDSLLDYISASAASRGGAQAESPLMRPGSYPQSESSRQPPPPQAPYRHLTEPRQFAPSDSPSAMPTPYDISPQIFSSSSRSGGLDEKPFTHYFDMPTERPSMGKAPSYLQQYAAAASPSPYMRPDAGCRLPSAQHLFDHRRPSHEPLHQTTTSPLEMGMPSPGTASSTPSLASSSPGLVSTTSVSSASSLSSSPSATSSSRPEKRYPCKFRLSLGCTSTFTTSGHASRHSNKHTREKMVQCTHPGCSRLFTRADNMQQHLRTHRKDKDTAAGRAAARSARSGSAKASSSSSSAARSERAASDESLHDDDQHRPLSLLQLASSGKAPGENPMQTLLRASELVLDKAQEVM